MMLRLQIVSRGVKVLSLVSMLVLERSIEERDVSG